MSLLKKHKRDDENKCDENEKSNKIKKEEETKIQEDSNKMFTMEEIKKKTIEKYNKLTEDEKRDNKKLRELATEFDIIEIINMNILENDICEKNNDIFYEDYKNLRYTITTSNRIKLLEKFRNNGGNFKDINAEYEAKDPKDLLKSFLLNIINLYTNIDLKPCDFYTELSSILKKEDYNIYTTFFAPANFGNMNFKWSLLYSEFLKYIDEVFFDKNNNVIKKNSTIKLKFEKRLKILSAFLTTIENKNNLLNDKLYYKYLRIINIIVFMCKDASNTIGLLSIIKAINCCMINLLNVEDIKKFINDNPKKLFIVRNEKEIELTNDNINSFSLEEKLIYKSKDNNNIDFNIKLYNKNVLDNLEINIKKKLWVNANFEYIQDYNFINSNENLKVLFKQHIKDMLESPYIKEVYFKTEERFETNNYYLFDGSDEIFNELYNQIIFFPFPIEKSFGFSNKNSLDIFITMYDNNDTFDLFGKLYANSNDIMHEIFHLSANYYIINSENKNKDDFNSKIPSEKKKSYIKTQKNFIEETKSANTAVKEIEIDFGDAIEIECYGFCIRDFFLKNICELFLKETWYDKEKIKNFKKNYIENNKTKEKDEKSSETKEKNEKKKENQVFVDINEYRKKSNIINCFFNCFPLDDDKTIYENKSIYIRKRNDDNKNANGLVYSRELRRSRYEDLSWNRAIEGGRHPLII